MGRINWQGRSETGTKQIFFLRPRMVLPETIYWRRKGVIDGITCLCMGHWNIGPLPGTPFKEINKMGCVSLNDSPPVITLVVASWMFWRNSVNSTLRSRTKCEAAFELNSFHFHLIFEVQPQRVSKRCVPSQSCQTDHVYCGGIRKKLITAMLCYPLSFHTVGPRSSAYGGRGMWGRLQRGDDSG